MNVFPREIRDYIASNGKRPFREWLISLESKDRHRVRERLERVRLGNFGDVKAIGLGVHELRLAFGPGYRIYFGQDGRSLVILLGGGEKAGQTADIHEAHERWMDYRRRTHAN